MGIYLNKPRTDKDSRDGSNAYLKFGVSAMQGWRMSMEDAHISEGSFHGEIGLFAVFDGHGGPEVAKFCAKYFGKELLQNKNFQSGDYKKALEENFLKMDEILMGPDGPKLLKEFRDDQQALDSFAGCTANVVLTTPTKLYIANAGDSRSILFNGVEVTPLSIDHKPDDEKEKMRIDKGGGYVAEGRINDNLNLSRAIGDFEYKKNKDLPPEE